MTKIVQIDAKSAADFAKRDVLFRHDLASTGLFSRDCLADLIDHIANLLPIVKEMNAMREKVQMNGHFRNILPPQV